MENQNPLNNDPDLRPQIAPEQPQNGYQMPTANSQHPVKKSHKKLLIIMLSLLLVAAAAGSVYWFVLREEKPPVVNSQTTQPEAPKPEVKQEEVDAAHAKFIAPKTGETWLAAPKPIPQQGYYKEPMTEQEVKYYEMGKRGANLIYMSVWAVIGDDIRLYEKSPDGKVTLIARPDSEAVYNSDTENFSEMFRADIVVDKDTRYDSLSVPQQLDLDKGYKLGKPKYTSLGDFIRPDNIEYQNAPVVTESRKIGASILKRYETKYADTKLTSISYRIESPIHTNVPVIFEPLETDLDGFKWQAGSSPGDKIHAITRGCGGQSSSISRSDSLTDADTKLVGKSPSGLDIYELKDPAHTLAQKAYEEFKEFYADDPNPPFPNLSKADFLKEHGIILHKDKFGQWLVYVRDQLAPAYGCAKPVVYLYPQSTQSVNVRVGANVKLSEPLYTPLTGWRNVIARPDGTLTYNGKQYGSLFWEGPGAGAYPSITTGTVVRTSDAMATIRTQMAQMGFNGKEISDFQDYWKDKLPSKPFTRLTWLNTQDMNSIAPLYITPKPDTVIRAFLDYSGLDSPIQIAPQKLTSTPRNGFTVTEWGGLSPFKLY